MHNELSIRLGHTRQDQEINHQSNPWMEVEMHLRNLVITRIDTGNEKGNLDAGKVTGTENVIAERKEERMATVLDINCSVVLVFYNNICISSTLNVCY